MPKATPAAQGGPGRYAGGPCVALGPAPLVAGGSWTRDPSATSLVSALGGSLDVPPRPGGTLQQLGLVFRQPAAKSARGREQGPRVRRAGPAPGEPGPAGPRAHCRSIVGVLSL